MDPSSSAELGQIHAFLQQLLPALSQARGSHGAAAPDAGAFRKLVAGEVQQLRGLLAHQAAAQLSGTIQLLDGPIAAAGSSSSSPISAKAAPHNSRQQRTCSTDAASLPALSAASADTGLGGASDVGTAGSDVCGAPGGSLLAAAAAAVAAGSSSSSGGGGPSADELVRDYAEAYASMKETMEVRLRHEQRRCDFLQGKSQQLEASLCDTSKQLEAANRRCIEQRAEHDKLAADHAELQQSLATSHAAHLALQQHHKGQMEAWQAERAATEQQHRQQLDVLQQELAAASGAAAGLVESSRQVEALRLLYNEELGRASRLAVELSKATAAADKAAAQEAAWAKQIATSDSRADNAQGMATAMEVKVAQREAALAKRQAKLDAQQADGERLRLMLERSRLAAVAEAAAARARTSSLDKQVRESTAQLASTTAALTAALDSLKLRSKELEGAIAQLKAGRSHMKQLVSDLESEQEKGAALTAALEESKAEASRASGEAEVASARLQSAQEQLGKANEAAAAMQEQLLQLEDAVQERTAAAQQMQVSLEAAAAAHSALEAEAGSLRDRLSDLVGVQQQLAQLRVEHEAATACASKLEGKQEVLLAKADQLLVATIELQELREQHTSLQASAAQLQEQLQAATEELSETRAAEHASVTQLRELQEQLGAANSLKAQLSHALAATSTAGEEARQEVAVLTRQLDGVQTALDAAETDRQVLAAQRDGWMASFQEAYGTLQEWTVSGEAAARKMATRANALQEAMHQLTSEAQAGAAADDSRAAAGEAAAGASPLSSSSGAGPGSGSASATDVMDQLSGLQQLLRAEANKQQDVFDNTLKALSRKVEERHQAAQASWQEAMAGSNIRRAARVAARAEEHSRKKQSLAAMAAVNSRLAAVHALPSAAAAARDVVAAAAAVEPHAPDAAPPAAAAAPPPAAPPPPPPPPELQQQKLDVELVLQQAAIQSSAARMPSLGQHPLAASGNASAAGANMRVLHEAASDQGQLQTLQDMQERMSAQAQQLQAHLQALKQQQQQNERQQQSREQPEQQSHEQPEQVAAMQQQLETQMQLYQQLQQQHQALQEAQQLPQQVQQAGWQQLVQQQQQQGKSVAAPGQPSEQQQLQALLHEGLQQQHGRLLLNVQQPLAGSVAASSPPAACSDGISASEQQSASTCAADWQQAVLASPDNEADGRASCSQPSSSRQGSSSRPSSRHSSMKGKAGNSRPVSAQHVARTHSVTQTITTTTETTTIVSCGGSSCVGRDERLTAVAGVQQQHASTTSSSEVISSTSAVVMASTPVEAGAFASGACSAAASAEQQLSAAHPVTVAAAGPARFFAPVAAAGDRVQQPAAAVSAAGVAVQAGPSQQQEHATPESHFQAGVHGHLGITAGCGAISSSASFDASSSFDASVGSFCSLMRPSGGATGCVGASGSGSMMAAGGSLSGFVLLATYQEQMALVAKLHGQVGEMAVQLREAHADADGAQQMLQQERQEAVSRTTVLRDALGQLHGQLEELRDDHKQLQESHRALMTKDLMNSGLLRDRYVADLFGRLQEALWKLDTARRRAATWGFGLLVPLGRSDRGIQTQPGEIWSLTAGAGVSSCVHSSAQPGGQLHLRGSRPASAAELELSASAEPHSVSGQSGAAARVERKQPAFTDHVRSNSNSGKRQPGASGSLTLPPITTAATGLATNAAPSASSCPHARLGSAGASGAHAADGRECTRSRSSTPSSASGRAAVGGATVKGSWGEVRLDNGKLLPAITPALLLQPSAAVVASSILSWPGISALLSWVAAGHFLAGLGPQELGRALMDVQAPHIHFLLLETADILQLHPLPRLHVVTAPSPFVRLLRLPLHHTAIGSAPATGRNTQQQQQQQQQQQAGASSKAHQSISLLMLSSAALQLLQPCELQAAMAAALASLALEGASAHDASSGAIVAAPQQIPGLPAGVVFADLATLSSLLALTPSFLLSHLPPEMHAMGGCLAAALTAVDRLVAAAGDRASLLVCQQLPAALAALLKTARVGMGAQAGADHDDEAVLQEWRQRVAAAAQDGVSPALHNLLPQHDKLASCSSSGRRMLQLQRPSDDGQLPDDAVVLLRVRELLAFADSQEYGRVLAAAPPLRRVLARPSSSSALGRSSSRSGVTSA